MANSPSFVQYALDLLTPHAPVTARAMFGGHGLYADGVMFGLLDDGELFLRSDEESEPQFKAAGCKPWVYPGPNGPMVTKNYQPPPAAMEDQDAMRPWFELALASAKRRQAAKRKPKQRKAASAKSKAAPRKAEVAGGGKRGPRKPAGRKGSARAPARGRRKGN